MSGFRALGASDVEPAPATAAEIADLEAQWGGTLPADHREFLLRVGRYDGPLLDDAGGEVLSQFRILGLTSIDNDLGYAVFEDRPELLPVAGMDSWRYCLRTTPGDAVDYVDLDLGSGDVTEGYGGTLTELLAAVIRRYTS